MEKETLVQYDEAIAFKKYQNKHIIKGSRKRCLLKLSLLYSFNSREVMVKAKPVKLHTDSRLIRVYSKIQRDLSANDSLNQHFVENFGNSFICLENSHIACLKMFSTKPFIFLENMVILFIFFHSNFSLIPKQLAKVCLRREALYGFYCRAFWRPAVFLQSIISAVVWVWGNSSALIDPESMSRPQRCYKTAL